ncbi:DUF3604 domain-containing protein [Mesorhizobium marinum]|uniref:DUF3604 domain-containing protein n=1 Tax=Mesorhizobium marinum TaxID=3228790 RepID=UPI003F5C72B6
MKRGLKLEQEFGTNPFKFGFVGSTDAHTGVSSTEENNFWGKFPNSEPSPERSTGNAFDFEGRTIKDWQLGASGLTAVWAGENSRASIWDAMKRKEVYATTGTRMFVRFFGFVGSTDAHTGISSAEENNFWGKFPNSEPSPERSTGNAFDFEGRTIKDWQLGASGLTAVWANENTRASIWDAMKRKEVYATTGTRMFVRFFGGWDFAAEDALRRDPAAVGYGKGVPMGSDLPPVPDGAKAPSFLVAALKDPLSGNLDRIQIVKGWLDAKGEMQEHVYDVVWAGDRKPGADGKVPLVGSTVDLPNATWTNTIGAPELIAVWHDPDFDPALKAFYYARVIEIPTPRWTAYDAAYFKETFAPEVPMEVTERAYASPIWYTPGG